MKFLPSQPLLLALYQPRNVLLQEVNCLLKYYGSWRNFHQCSKFCQTVTLLDFSDFQVLTCSFIVISCSICSIWSVVEASVSKPGITMVDGSSAGFHLSGFGGMVLREVSESAILDLSQDRD